MFYCPKCERKYKDGSQRFCNNDGGRLLPAVKPGNKKSIQQKGVFTSLLGRTPSRFERDEKLAGSVPAENKPGQRQGFEPPVKSKTFRSEHVIAPEAGKAREIKAETVERHPPVIALEKVRNPKAQPPVTKMPRNEQTVKTRQKTETIHKPEASQTVERKATSDVIAAMS